MTQQERTTESMVQEFGWVPVSRYLSMFPEDNMNAIRQRKFRKFWLDGVHIKTVPGMGTWVHLGNIKSLITGNPPRQTSDSVRLPEPMPE